MGWVITLAIIALITGGPMVGLTIVEWREARQHRRAQARGGERG
ncbi:MAG: hypothetical protein Q8Q14_12285 [Gemmatimonadales bacterium]|nr:hypothetical protein [Gemmatimonadales bacterium]